MRSFLSQAVTQLNSRYVQLHVQVRESVDSLIHKGGESVQLSGVEVTAEDAAHVSAGEASAHGGIRGSGQVTELKLEGVEECIDDGNLETQGAGDNGHHQSQEAGEQGSDQLCQDDGGKHHHEHWDEVGELAQVQPLLLGGAIARLVISVVVGGAGGGVPSPGGRGVGGVVASVGDSVLSLGSVSVHLQHTQADTGSEQGNCHGHLVRNVEIRRRVR